ncbi:MAG: AAA family ATPase [Bacteroidales bacterium]|nr:AAA family ATPase [Bacteroidales bacterium]
MNSNIINAFRKMIDVNTPIICIQDYDFVRIDELIKEVTGGKKVLEWNPATGATNFKTKEQMGEFEPLDTFLQDKYVAEPVKPQELYLVLKDVQDYLDDPKVKSILHLMAQRRLYGTEYDTTVIIVSSYIQIPQEIEKYVSYLEIGFVNDEDEIRRLINEHTEVNKYHDLKEEDIKKLMPSLKGMTLFEIDRMLDMAMSSNGSLSSEDSQMILQQKKQMVKQSGLLELIDTPASIDGIGGMNFLKNYLKNKQKVFANPVKAQEFNLSTPKGIFIVGMPGCGKSLCAKATASFFNAPLLKMDMGSMMGKYVGQSEANLRKAIQIAEAAAPCVLWIDEIEKAFSGSDGSSNNDIMVRMFGYFLSWMQDKTSSVYVIATANNAERLPPELKRKGRFDEIFCVNLPNKEERKSIFEVHLKKKGQREDLASDTALINATEGFNGADIEAVVNDSLEKLFIKSADSNWTNASNQISTQELIATAKETVSIKKSCKQQIENMEKVFKQSSFKDATTGKLTSTGN